MGMTILVLGVVVWVIIKWIEQLKNMGKAHESIRRVNEETRKAFKSRVILQNFGCHHFISVPQNCCPVLSNKVGYVQNIDIASLAQIAQNLEVEIFVTCEPGDFCHVDKPLLMSSKPLTPEQEKSLASTFSIGVQHTFRSDPRYGISVLAAIGSKSLSPALNDPGTAIDVVTNLASVLTYHCELMQEQVQGEKLKNVYFRKLSSEQIFFQAFYALIKDGIGQPQLILAVKEALLALRQIGDEEFKAAAQAQLDFLLSRAEATQNFLPDLALLQDLRRY